MFDLGIQELIVIFVVALIVFGPKRLPELGRTIGKGMAELRRAMEGVRAQMHAEMEPSVKPLLLSQRERRNRRVSTPGTSPNLKQLRRIPTK